MTDFLDRQGVSASCETCSAVCRREPEPAGPVDSSARWSENRGKGSEPDGRFASKILTNSAPNRSSYHASQKIFCRNTPMLIIFLGVDWVLVVCSPKLGPGGMRASDPSQREEILDGQATHDRPDHRQTGSSGSRATPPSGGRT